MPDLFADPSFYRRRSSAKQPVVPTTYGKASHDWGKYESATLPNLDQLLDRTLDAIEQSHNLRERSSRSFDALWGKVCEGLKDKKNATSFEHWKNASLLKNRKRLLELETRVKDARVKRFSPERQDDPALRAEDIKTHEDVERERANLKPKIKVTTDDILEVAIAYWIEAKNARDSGDDMRCLHALIECWTNIGTTRSTKTESEAKSDAGAKQGKRKRDAIADIVTNEIRAIILTREMMDPIYLLGSVLSNIQRNPDYAHALKDYEAHAVAGKKVGDDFEDRMVATLLRWATRKDLGYTELATAYESALHRAKSAKKSKLQK